MPAWVDCGRPRHPPQCSPRQRKLTCRIDKRQSIILHYAPRVELDGLCAPIRMPIFPKIQLSDETAKPVVSALLEIFSPATELIGWAGDAVRIHRARSALKCFSRTKQIAAEAGLVLKAPPVKFLSQYIENCSLEDETDNELIEWWARMLVDAGIKYKSKHVFYANVLKQLGTTEVELLEILVRNCTGNYLLRFVGEAQFVSDFNFPGEGLALSNKFSEILIRQSIKKIRSTFERPGVLILNIFVDDDRS